MNTQYTLKIRSNIKCKIYIDDDYKATTNNESLTKIILDKGEYWVRVEDDGNSNNYISQTIQLNQDKVLNINLDEIKLSKNKSEDLSIKRKAGDQKTQVRHSFRYAGQPIDLIFDIIAAIFVIGCIICGIIALADGEIIGLALFLAVVPGGLRIWARKDYYIS